MKKLLLGAALLMLSGPAWSQQTPRNLPTKNSSVAIATGNTFQSVLAAAVGGTQRNSLTIQNNNTNADSCWVFVGPNASATKATSILLAQGASYTRYYPFIPSDNISATCATTADTLYVDTQ